MPPRPARPDLPLAAAPGPLLDLVRAAAADRGLWAPAVRFDAARRHWSRLLSAPDVDLWLLTPAGRRTPTESARPAAPPVAVLPQQEERTHP